MFVAQCRPMTNPFRYFNSSPEVIRLTVMMYIRHLGETEQVLSPGKRHLTSISEIDTIINY